LVRVWEDLRLLPSMLHDGGFDTQLRRFEGIVSEVVDYSFSRARNRYRSLFDQRNGYTWYTPTDDAYVDVIYELANTYLGKIRSDVLGQVYERTLERIDRKLLGQYYTPRDVIRLIWDLIDLDSVADDTENAGRQPRVLDIATGSGGFLVEAAGRLRDRLRNAQRAGAAISTQDWLNDLAEGLNGIEVQRFSSYLAELNLLVQLGQVAAADTNLRIPPLGIISADSLALHEPGFTLTDGAIPQLPNDLLVDSEERLERATRIKSVRASNFQFDVACGNPPYVGEKLAASIMAHTRALYPYWDQFVGPHMDYLYWFLILGVSKLRVGGRFGFITTEYWLRAAGAAPLREYLSARCQIDRIVLFRDFRLFPDAPGQHSMIVTGTRVVEDVSASSRINSRYKPRVSIYRGPTVRREHRNSVIRAMRMANQTANVHSFSSAVSPNTLGRGTWADVILTPREIASRSRLREIEQLPLIVSKGVETTVNALSTATEGLLSRNVLAVLGGPGRRCGIQLLSTPEVDALGPLNTAEQRVVRKVVNTRDVYPYAVVLPNEGTNVLYLAKTDGYDENLSDEQVITGSAFPGGLPRIEAHLTQYRALLEHKTRDRGERRPWWTLHRPRANVVGDASVDQTGWARYCLTTRWGGGGRLIVGVAPGNTSPASGLHVLRPGRPELPAAYLAAVYNSTIYQEIAESLPPGQLRQEDLERMGLPDLGVDSNLLVGHALELARIVSELVNVNGPRWPQLQDSLRADVSLSLVPDASWAPEIGPRTSWGALGQLDWVSEVGRHRAGSTRLGEVVIDHDLFGLRVSANVRGEEHNAVSVALRAQDEQIAEALASVLRGIAAKGGSISDAVSTPLPISAQKLVETYSRDKERLTELVTNYRLQRQYIDDLLGRII
jgi:hypothetical protein